MPQPGRILIRRSLQPWAATATGRRSSSPRSSGRALGARVEGDRENRPRQVSCLGSTSSVRGVRHMQAGGEAKTTEALGEGSLNPLHCSRGVVRMR